MAVDVANFLAQGLRERGVEYLFLLTGGDQALWLAMEDAGITPILARSEASAVYMADGYARRSGTLGVVYGQSGPGTANAAAALADPYWNRSSILLITSCASVATQYRNDYQELATDGMLEPVTIASYRLPDPSRIQDLLPAAIDRALAEGPVSISIPRDQFVKPVVPSLDTRSMGAPIAPHAAPHGVRLVAEAIEKAERPLLLVGAGASGEEAGDLVSRFAEQWNVPIVATVGGKTTVPDEHTLWVGVVGRYSSKAANELAGEADLVLALGTRLGGLATDGYRLFDTEATLIQVDRSSAALRDGLAANVGICADITSFVSALLEIPAPSNRYGNWVERVHERIQQWRRDVDSAPTIGTNGALKPYGVFSVLNDHAHDINVVADTGYMAAWSSVLYRTHRPHSYFRANGSLGWSLPATLGVQIADTAKRAVCISGDGGIGYHIADLETAVRCSIPAIVLVLNNQGLAFEYHAQLHKWGGRVIPAVNDLLDVDHGAVARAFGAFGRRVTDLPSFRKAFEEALDHDGPALIDVVVDREEFAPVTSFDGVIDRRV